MEVVEEDEDVAAKPGGREVVHAENRGEKGEAALRGLGVGGGAEDLKKNTVVVAVVRSSYSQSFCQDL